MDLRSIDLHLLVCFDALMTDRSVTHAAHRMNLSQPAMSNALARMRELFNDQLLVRTNKGMAPTPRAEQLHGAVKHALQTLQGVFADPESFDADTAQARFQIAMTDYTSLVVLPRLLPMLRQQAPHIDLVLVPPDRSRLREWLEEGLADLAIGYFVDLPEGLRATELFRDGMCCIASASHPTIRGALDLQAYIANPHVYWGGAQTHPFTMEAMVDRALNDLGLQRRVVLRSLSAPVLAQAVACSDMLGTTARLGAARHAEALGVQVLDLPFSVPEGVVSMVWHERTHRSAGAKWLRDGVRRALA